MVQEKRALTHRTDELETKAWLNLPELMHDLGGDGKSAKQKAYCNQLWRAAAGRAERAHPDGNDLPKQRLFTLSSRETATRRREDTASAGIRATIEDPAVLQQLMGALKAPGMLVQPPGAADPAGERAAKKPRRDDEAEDDAGEDDPPPARTALLGDLYKLVPRLWATLDKLPAGKTGDFLREPLDKKLAEAKRAKTHLEDTGFVHRERLAEIAQLVKTATEDIQRVDKAMKQLRHFG